jgi:hypothetical protein
VRDLLLIGHKLPFRVLDAQERLLLGEGNLLIDEAQFEALVERGAWAERSKVEAERAALLAAGHVGHAKPAPSLFDRWERLLWDFDTLTRSPLRRQTGGLGVTALFASLEALVDREPDVALFLALSNNDRRFALYPLTHSIHCAVLALLTARQLAWDPKRVASVACAALTMNLAMFELQAAMAEQDTPPTARQLKHIRVHPEATVQLLRAAGIDDEEWLLAVAQHHEQLGGSGYPLGLTDVAQSAQVLRAVDVYMAKVSARANRHPMAAQKASRQLFELRPRDPVAMALIKTVGVHPPGSLLQLRSGEVAVAIHRPASGTHPLVATLSDRSGRPIAQTNRRDTAQPEFAVQAALVEPQGFSRVMPERVYGLLAG